MRARGAEPRSGNPQAYILGLPAPGYRWTRSHSRGVLDHLMSRAGLSEELMPSRDIWGEPRKGPDTLGPRVLSPITIQEQEDNMASNELARLKVNVEPPERKMHLGTVDMEYRVELTPREYDYYARNCGAASAAGRRWDRAASGLRTVARGDQEAEDTARL
jgi:hypothetical protein